MNFKDNKAIYLQIADRIGDQILSGALTPEGKVPSVRELAAEIEVNANTVARTYDHLQQNGVIYTKRGLGYFVSPDAQEAHAGRNGLFPGPAQGRGHLPRRTPGTLSELSQQVTQLNYELR